ncbi:MAG: hypothetical protein PHR16_05835 [Methylovulum sp.]|nr:hypothetical protein [Methylovulum sp.]
MTKNLFPQQGAVLAFTLLLLLMITLMGVTMVQQNRTQFMMAENTQSEATNFSTAENILKSTENYIASQRYAATPLPDPIPADCFDATSGAPKLCATYDCKTPGGIFQQLMPGDLRNGAVIHGMSTGSSVEITKTVCVGGDTLGLQYDDCSNSTRNFCAFTSNVPNPTASSSATTSSNPCHTELYTIRATMIDDANNERVVESNYAVRCDN